MKFSPPEPFGQLYVQTNLAQNILAMVKGIQVFFK